MRTALLASFYPYFAPVNDGMGGGGDDTATAADNVLADVEAAYAELEGAPDGGTEGLGDGGQAKTPDQGEPARQAGRDGEQAKEGGQDGQDRGDGRTNKGQFVAKDKPGDKPGDKPVVAAEAKPADQRGEQKAPGQDDAGALAGTHPPSSFSPRSKASWEQLRAQFPWIAADIAKREGEVGEGLAALRDFKDLKPYADMARNSNTTLSAALHRFTNLEQLTKRSPAHGLVSVCASIGMPKAEALESLRTAARLIGGDIEIPAHRPAGDALTSGQPSGDQKSDDPLVKVLAPILQPLLQEVGELRKYVSDFQTSNRTQAESSLDAAITSFSADPKNVYYNDVADQMTNLFKTRMVPLTGNHAADLRAAYDMACKLHPEVSEALIEQRLGSRNTDAAKRERAIAERARQAGRSLAGSSSPSDVERGTPTKRGDGKPSDNERLDQVTAAYDQVAGAASY